MILSRYGLVGSALLLALASGCSSNKEETGESELAMVSTIQCSIARGAFIPKTAAGEVDLTCPTGSVITFNNQQLQGNSVKLKPKTGLNVVHVDEGGGAFSMTDIAFLYGDFKAPNTLTPNAIGVRIGSAGLNNGGVQLPLPAGPTPVNVSQIASQVLRDQGNLLARLDGKTKDVSAGPFSAAVRVIRSSYDNKSVIIGVTPRDGGVHLDVAVENISSLIGWSAGVAGLDLGDQITASVGKATVSADVNLAYDPATKGVKATLGAHDVRVSDLDIDSAILSGIPFGLGDGLEDAIAGGAEALLNTFADPLLDAIKGIVLPKLEVNLEQLKLPKNLAIPFLGGSVDIQQQIDSASFQASGIALTLGAGVMAPANSKVLPAPGFFSLGSKAPTFDSSQAFDASLSLDYVNQALYAVWKQGLLNRQLSGPISVFGISTGALVSDAKQPPVLTADPEGRGVNLNLGEFHVNTVFHGTSGGDAKVKVAVSVIAGAILELGEGGHTLVIKPSGDDARTKVVAELVGIPKGSPEAAEELSGILQTFTPVLEAMVGHDLELPPVAIPEIDLGVVTPGFAGRKGTFNGQIKVDGPGNRIGIAGKIMAQ